MLSSETAQELKTLIREDYRMELSDKEVEDVASTLVGYFEVLMSVNRDSRPLRAQSEV